MPSYDQWNQAVVYHYTKGTPLDSKIYLSVDDNVLTLIGQSFFSSSVNDSWVHNFCNAVRERVLFEETVSLQRLKEPYSDGTPQYVAFLLTSTGFK